MVQTKSVKRQKISRWIKIIGGLLGLWLLAAPITFGYQSHALMISDWICGLLLLLLAPIFPIAVYGIVGMWLGLAPLLLWSPDAACYLNDTFVSVLIFSLFIPLSSALHLLPSGSAIPPGWTYNPSTWPQRLPIAFLAFICWMISRYLAAYQLGYIHTIWDPFFDQGTVRVLTSDVSQAFPVSDAGLGAFAYTLEMLSAFIGNERRWRTMPWMVLVFGILTVPVSLVSVILIILQPLVVGAWCTLCLATAVCMLIGIPLAINEVLATLHYLRGNWREHWTVLFHGGECPAAKIDRHPVSLDGPLLPLLREVKKGIAIPWNLALCSLLGAIFMALPGIFAYEGYLADIDHIFGALIVVASVVAFAGRVRVVRLANVVFTMPILLMTFYYPDKPMFHWVMGILVILLSIYKSCLGLRNSR
jgi:uncharacterized membrane protein